MRTGQADNRAALPCQRRNGVVFLTISLQAHPMSRPILVVYAHPTPLRSRVNRRLAQAAASMPHAELLDLYETAPDFHIDVAAAQQQLLAARLLVFLHPLYWYGMPALLKHWVDMVLTEGWAYGPEGTALRGKDFLLAVTTGGAADAYGPGGEHGFRFADFLPPIRQTAAFCGMRWQAPLVLHDAHQVSNETVDAHIDRFRTLLSQYLTEPTA